MKFCKDILKNEQYDIIVAGAGPAGIAAAAAAGREGKKVLLIEASGQLGGMATTGLVPAWTPYSDGVRIIYGGLSERIFKETKAKMPHIDKDRVDWVAIDYEALKENYANLLKETGVEVLYHTTVCDVVMKDERNIDSVVVANKSGICAYSAPVFIDCTGDADIYAFADGEFEVGENGDLQPGTMCFILTNIDEEILNSLPYIHSGNADSIIHTIVKEGKYNVPDTHFCHSKIGPKTYGFNAGHVWDADPTNPEELSKRITEGRELVHQLVLALKEYHPAFKDAFLVQTAPTLGIRETRRIVGDYTFTKEDYFERKSFDDEISRNNYWIDIHKSARENIEWGERPNADDRYERYKDGESHGLPYRCLCPKHLDNLLVAGRCISTDRTTQGSLRVMPSCLCEGEAAGVAAAVMLESAGANIHTVDVHKVQTILKQNGAYLPNFK